jgi:hypothetical protein
MIGHPAIGVQSSMETLEYFRHNLVEHPSVFWRKEYILTMIAAKRHVIERTGDMNTRFARHPCTYHKD